MICFNKTIRKKKKRKAITNFQTGGKKTDKEKEVILQNPAYRILKVMKNEKNRGFCSLLENSFLRRLKIKSCD